MYCNQCGREVDIGWNVCPNCGAPISKQGVGNEYYHDGGNMYNDRPIPQMKWYKFIIYVQIFGNVLLCLYYAYETFAWLNYGMNTKIAYEIYGGLKGLDYIMGTVYILYAVSLLFIRHQLWKYRKNAPKLYLMFYCVFAVVRILYLGMQGVIVNANFIDFQAIMDIIYPVIYIVLNHIYFKKREYLFIN